MNKLIVSRHLAAIEFIRQELPDFTDAPIVAEATVEDVQGAWVVGNLPLHLAAHCHTVTAVEFTGTPPRGMEYTIDDMRAAGARLRAYHVQPAPACVTPGRAWFEYHVADGCAIPSIGRVADGMRVVEAWGCLDSLPSVVIEEAV